MNFSFKKEIYNYNILDESYPYPIIKYENQNIQYIELSEFEKLNDNFLKSYTPKLKGFKDLKNNYNIAINNLEKIKEEKKVLENKNLEDFDNNLKIIDNLKNIIIKKDEENNLKKELENQNEIKLNEKINEYKIKLEKYENENKSLLESIKTQSICNEKEKSILIIEINKLKNEIEDYKLKNNENNKKINAFNQEILKLEKENEKLENQIGQYNKKNNNLLGDINTNNIKKVQEKIEENNNFIMNENFKKILILKNCRDNIISNQHETILEFRNLIKLKESEIENLENRIEKLENRIKILRN